MQIVSSCATEKVKLLYGKNLENPAKVDLKLRVLGDTGKTATGATLKLHSFLGAEPGNARNQWMFVIEVVAVVVVGLVVGLAAPSQVL
jgi:hypothetical protein